MDVQKSIIKPLLPRGMRDQAAGQLAVRLRVIETLRGVFELYGFQPLETPAMERLEVLSGKGGDESDKLSFLVMKRGAELERALERVKGENLSLTEAQRELADMGLRYDLTVPLARFTAMNQGKLTLPYKRYQIGSVWRAERPQQGRYREFTQCDVDIVGADTPVADAEIALILIDGLDKIEAAFNIGLDPSLRINHRGILEQASQALGNAPARFQDFCICLDKLDKIGRDGVLEDMKGRGLKTDRLDEFWEFVTLVMNSQFKKAA